jgi:hypothetical protein
MLVIPIATFVILTTSMHKVLHVCGLGVLTASVGSVLLINRHSEYSLAHGVAGIMTYAVVFGIVLVGIASTEMSRIVRTPALTLVHRVGARLLLTIALPFQLLTGIVVLMNMDADNEIVTTRSCFATLGVLAIAGAYAFMSRSIRPSTPLPVLLRAYSAFALENICVVVVGVAAALYSLYFVSNTTRSLVRTIASACIVLAGIATLLFGRVPVIEARQLPASIVRGVPVMLVCCTTAIIGVVTPWGASAYSGTGIAIVCGALFVIALMRCVRALHLMPVPLGVVAIVGFASQSAAERYFDEASRSMGTSTTVTLIWFWGLMCIIGALTGVYVCMCAAYTPKANADEWLGDSGGGGGGDDDDFDDTVELGATATRRRRHQRRHVPRARTDEEHEQLHRSVEDFIAEARRAE